MADFKSMEARIRNFWNERDIFTKSTDPHRGGKARKDFVFFEGPPTANAGPGIHHFIGRSFKDLFCRYKTMRGFRVLRKGGWDTHGLPVELQVERALGFKSKKDIEKYGIAKFNAKCRESVWQFKGEWEEFTRRMAFWLDLNDPYVTYEAPYVESLWAVIRRMNDRGLLYRAHRVVPYCTRCGTPLSSHEVAQGYKTVTDASVYVLFKLKTDNRKPKTLKFPKGTSVVAWTTTPWTLPGNVALAVGADIEYVLARRGEEFFVVAKDLAVAVLGAPLAIEAEFRGSDLVGMAYEPLFRVKALASPRSYKVLAADFVSTTEGTGVVHTAVMYGEDDYRLGQSAGLPTRHTVDQAGKFMGVSPELNGRYVKDAKTEELILSHLSAKGRVLKTLPYEHEYPFCWRCETPLLYYATDSWFVRMSSLRAKLLAANDTVNWIPAHLKEGRFGQWLREGKDWAFSRERYWGTPLPVWMERPRPGHFTGEPLVIGSYDELDEYRADKPATFWVMRHGEATKNVEHVIDQGQTKSPLTAAGRSQAVRSSRALKTKLAKERIRIAAVVSSPIQRTRETAELAAAELGVKRVIHDDRLREIRLGPSLVGCHDSKYHELYPTYESKFRERPEGGESLADLKARMWNLLKDLNAKYAGKHVLLVGHEYPIWMLAAAANGWDERRAIAEKKERDPKDFVAFAAVERLVVRNLPRNEAGDVDPHRPYIDDIVLKRPRSAKKLYRIPDLADVWFDSGSMPLAQWHWPFKGSEEMVQEQFPADFIAEGIDQTRGWFYTLLAVSVALGRGAPYRNVLSFSHVLDEKGQKMSKSKGNVIKPDAVMDEVGVDAARWYFYAVNNPGDTKLFSVKEVRERLTGFIMTLENCVRFWELYGGNEKVKSINGEGNYHHGDKPAHLLDRWLLSRLHRVTAEATSCMDAYDPTAAARALEDFAVNDLSQWWLRRSRRRSESRSFLRHVLLELDKLIAPFVPYVAEDWHQRLHAGPPVGGASATESVHLHDWPGAVLEHMDRKLEEDMAQVRAFITAGLAQRSQAGIRVRQPLASVSLPGAPLLPDLEQLVKDELNVKKVEYVLRIQAAEDVHIADGVHLETNISPELRREGWVREVMRQVQDMRKEAGYKLDAKVRGYWHAEDEELAGALERWSGDIQRDTLLSEFTNRRDEKAHDVVKEFELAPGKKLWIAVEK